MPKQKRLFGSKINVKNIGTSMKRGGGIASVGGKHIMEVGQLTGQPKLVAAGAGLMVAGKATKKGGKILKKANKKHKEVKRKKKAPKKK